MANVNRREFLRWLLSGAAVSVLSRCAPTRAPASASPTTTTTPLPSPTPTPSPAPTPSPVPLQSSSASTPTPSPTPSPTPYLLRNENRPGFYIRYYKAFAPVDPDQWALDVTGNVRSSQRLSFADMLALPRVSQTSRMVCVEGWSVAAKWEGFTPQTLVDRVRPHPDVTWVHFHCADGYYESLAFDELLMDRIIFVYGMNDALLLPEYGAPLRVIVPPKYAYKGAKAITRIIFSDQELPGYWPTVAGYSTEGMIWPGPNYALDLRSQRRILSRGEVFFEDGIESLDP